MNANLMITERLYSVDEALLENQQEKHRLLMEELERLEKESHAVSMGFS